MAEPLCEACNDDGRQTLDPEFRGGAERAAGACPVCPRCAVCESRLAESREAALQVEGWDPFCGLSHLVAAMQSRSAAERALYALDVLGAPPLAQPGLAELLAVARHWLEEFTRALVSGEIRSSISSTSSRSARNRFSARLRSRVHFTTTVVSVSSG